MGTYFVDISPPALSEVEGHGGVAIRGEITALPFPPGAFDLTCAFDIVEHVDDDQQVFRELCRVTRENGAVVFSVPLHSARWNAFDALVGHVRRYDPDDLITTLRKHAFVVERSAPFGMQPQSGWLLDFAVWSLVRRPLQALHWYNTFLLPLGLLLQKQLAWKRGLVDMSGIDELVVVCRRCAQPSSAHSGRRASATPIVRV